MRGAHGHGIVALAACLLVLGVTVPPAYAAAGDVEFDIAVFPAGAFTPRGVAASTSTGSYAGFVDGGPSCGSRCATTRIEQIRGGVVVPRLPGALSVQVGDVFRLIRADSGVVVGQTTYDGTPSLADTTCIGQNRFTGKVASGAEVKVQVLGSFGNGRYGTARLGATGIVQSLANDTMSGIFSQALVAGDLLSVTETVRSLNNGVLTTVKTSVTRLVAVCPVPPPADTVPPKATSFDLRSPRTSIASFLRTGLTSFVGINEPGTVVQALYLDNGAKLPAAAAKTAKRATLLGSGKATSTSPGVVKVVVRRSGKARGALKGKRSARVVLLTTITDAAGNRTTLKPKKLKFGK